VAAGLLWLTVTIGFGTVLVLEHKLESCEIYSSTYGEKHWQRMPPGTYCTMGPWAGEFPVPADWDRPAARRSVAVLVLAGSGVLIAVVTASRRWRARSPDPQSGARL
jgi:hypothetical protein